MRTLLMLAAAALCTGCPADYVLEEPSPHPDGGDAWMCVRDCASEDELARASAERICDCEAYRDDP